MIVIVYLCNHRARAEQMRQTRTILDAVVRGRAVGDFAGGKGGDGGEEVRQSTRDKGAHRVIRAKGGT